MVPDEGIDKLHTPSSDLRIILRSSRQGKQDLIMTSNSSYLGRRTRVWMLAPALSSPFVRTQCELM